MKSQLNKNLKNENGITLIELLLVVILIVVIVVLISATLIQSVNTSRGVIDIAASEIDSRLALYRMSKDIREAFYITSADYNSITFTCNVDGDDAYETVSYYFESEDSHYKLMRQVDSTAPNIIINNIIENNIFTYYKDSRFPEGVISTPVEEVDLNNIKIIELNIRVDQSGAESLRTMDLDTMVTLRNKL